MPKVLQVCLAVALLTSWPPVAAQAGVSGEMRFDEPPRFDGEGTWSASNGTLQLGEAAAAGLPLGLRWQGMQGVLVRKFANTALQQVPQVKELTLEPESRQQDVAVGAGRIGKIRCDAGCFLALIAMPDGGHVGFEGRLAGALEAVDEPPPTMATVAPDEFNASLGALQGWRLAVHFGPNATSAPEARPFAQGKVRLVAFGAAISVVSGNETHDLDARRYDRPMAGPVPANDTSYGFLIVDLTSAELDLPSGAPARLDAPALDATFAGRISGKGTGEVQVQGQTHAIRSEEVDLRGRLALRHEVRQTGDGADALSPQDGSRQRASFSGDVDEISLGLFFWRLPNVVAHRAATHVSLLAFALAAAAMALSLGATSPFYSRIGRREVLENATRLRVYERIRDNPGEHLAGLSRAVGVGRMVLVYHLRVLEGLGLVSARRKGARLIFFAGGVPRDDGAQRALDVGSRRRVAEAVVRGEAGVTQADIVALTGLSQRLVSYHLERLREACLVEVHPGTPRRYSPGAGLRHALEQHGSAA